MFNHNEFTRDAMAVLTWRHGTVHISLLVTTMFFKVMGNCRGSAFDVWQGSFLYVYTPVEWPICILSQTVEYDVERFFLFLLNFEGKQVGPVRDKVTSGEKNNEKAGGGGTKTFLLRSSGGNTNRFQVSVPFPLPYAKRMHCLYRHREKLSHPLMKVIVDPPARKKQTVKKVQFKIINT